MTKAGFKAPVRSNIRDEIWLKILGNVSFNPLSVLTELTLDKICTDSNLLLIVNDLMLETQAVGEKLGAHFPISIERRIAGKPR